MDSRHPPDRVTHVLWLDPAPDALAVSPLTGRIVGVGAVLPGVAIEHILRESVEEQPATGPDDFAWPKTHLVSITHRGHVVLHSPLFRAVSQPARNLLVWPRVSRDDAIRATCSRPGTRVWVMLEEA